MASSLNRLIFSFNISLVFVLIMGAITQISLVYIDGGFYFVPSVWDCLVYHVPAIIIVSTVAMFGALTLYEKYFCG